VKVLVIGGGGREHAIAWKLAQSPRRPRLYCAPGNGGTAEIATNLDIEAGQTDRLLEFAQRERIDLTVVGPEDPLCAGIVDRFEAAGLRIFGPRAAAARLEGDKAFAKLLMRACDVPTADARVFVPSEQEREHRLRAAQTGNSDVPTRLARDYVATREAGLVVKAAGLARGKGVFVCNDPAEALLALEKLMVDRIFGEAGDAVVVEERLVGTEVSLMALVDGRSIYLLEPARDYKRLLDGDAGPNTGGMGAYSPVADLTDELAAKVSAEVFVPIIDGLRREGIDYKGVLYAGLMLTAGGPKVLEFNCRFGDPETQPVLMRLKSDLVDLFEAVIDGRLDEAAIEWDARPAVCVVLASGGYPDKAQAGLPIRGLDAAARVPDVQVFHAGTRRSGGRVETAGGRVLGVTAVGETFDAARRRAYEAAQCIGFDGMRMRSDIAATAT
jgi:phosphoribosylamine--glycine ligase